MKGRRILTSSLEMCFKKDEKQYFTPFEVVRMLKEKGLETTESQVLSLALKIRQAYNDCGVYFIRKQAIDFIEKQLSIKQYLSSINQPE